MARLSCFTGRTKTASGHATRTAANRLRISEVIVSWGRRRRRRRRRWIAIGQIVSERSQCECVVARDCPPAAVGNRRIHNSYVPRTCGDMLPVTGLPTIAAVRTGSGWPASR